MYNPFALDTQRIELERLRRRVDNAPRWPEPAASTGQEHAGYRRWLHRRPATAC